MSRPPKAQLEPIIERLDPSHDRSSFDCGNETLNRYLKSIATQDLRRGLAITYVATFPPDKAAVGYFTLSAASIDLGNLPENVRKKLPTGAVIGSSLLGRLAVARSHKRQGLGGLMIASAVDLSFAKSPLACAALIVDAIDDDAVEFYRRFGFIRFPEGPRRLFLLREALAKYL